MIYLFEGKGPIIPIVAIAVVAGGHRVWEAIESPPISQYERVFNCFLLVLTAAILIAIGRKLNTHTSRTLLDPKTNEEVVVKQRHALLGGSADTWGYVLGAFGVYTVVHGVVTGTLLSSP